MTMSTPLPRRIPMARRLVVGTVWALAWLVAWGGALVLFSTRALDQGPVTTLPRELRWAQRQGSAGATAPHAGGLLQTIDPVPLRQAAADVVSLVH